MPKNFEVTTTVEVTPQRIQDLLNGAFEGGSNYWLGNGLVSLVRPNVTELKRTGVVWWGEEDLFEHEELKITIMHEDPNADNDEEREYVLDRESMQKGLELMSSKYAPHFADFMEENDDAATADVFLQCCLFQEVVYG